MNLSDLKGDVLSARLTKSAAYTIAAADRNKVIACTGGASFTLSLPPVASVGAGFRVWISKADGSGIVTIDPDAAETIDGLAAIKVYQESFLVWTDGAAWHTQHRRKGWVPIGSVALTGQALAALSITDGFLDPEIGEVEIKFENLKPSESATCVFRQIKNGSAVISSTSGVVDAINTSGTTTPTASSNSAGATSINLVSTASLGPVAGTINARNTLTTVPADQRVEWDAKQVGATRRGVTYETSVVAQLGGISLLASVGTLASISYTVRGYRP